MPAPKNTLGKEKRLKSRKLIEGLFKKGSSISVFPFRVIYQFQNEAGPALQAGFAAPAKNFKKAVHRNRIKRLTKEAYRLNYQELEQTLLKIGKRLTLFFVFTAKELPQQDLVTLKISVILQQLVKKIHESGPSNS